MVREYPGARAGFLGRVPFGDAWALQRKIWEERAGGRISEDIFLFLEHDPVFTLGAGGSEANVISRRFPDGPGDDDADGGGKAGAKEIPLVRINRGGEVTYHGPGQLMLYAICDLRERERDVHTHCRRLEEVFLRYLAGLGVAAERREDMPGLWVEGQKILSLGVGARRWVTMHGVAFNIAPDMRFFEMIHACGEVGGRAVSLERLTGLTRPLGEVARALAPICREVFGQEVAWSRDIALEFSAPAPAAEGGS